MVKLYLCRKWLVLKGTKAFSTQGIQFMQNTYTLCTVYPCLNPRVYFHTYQKFNLLFSELNDSKTECFQSQNGQSLGRLMTKFPVWVFSRKIWGRFSPPIRHDASDSNLLPLSSKWVSVSFQT